MQAQEESQRTAQPTLHDEIQGFKERLSNVGPEGKQGLPENESKSASKSSQNNDYHQVNQEDGSDETKGNSSDETYDSVYKDMFQALAKHENAYDQKVFRAFIAQDFANRFVDPQTRSKAEFRDATTQLLQSESAVDGQPSKSEGTKMSPGDRHTAELGMQQVKNIAAIIGQVAKDSPKEAQKLFSQLDSTLQKQVMSVRSGSFTYQQKLALLEGVHNNMLGNVISGTRALVSALSLASLGAIFAAGFVLGGPVGGTFAVGIAEMGAVSAHFMASRAARVFASTIDYFRLDRELSKVNKEIADLVNLADRKDPGNDNNEETKDPDSPKLSDQQKEQLSQLEAKRMTLLAKRDAAKKQILLKATEFFSGASMLVIVAMIPPPVTIALVLAALSDFVGSKLEKFSHRFTGAGVASKAARAFFRVFSFALQLPKKLFQGVNNLGKLSEAQAIKTENGLLSVALQVMGAILQAPNKLVNGITSIFTKSPEETMSEDMRYSAVYGADNHKDQPGTKKENKRAETVKEGVKDNVKEQKVEMTVDVAKESVHLATRAAGGEFLASFFDVQSSAEDLYAYFITQPKEKKHLAALLDVVHQEVHAVSAPVPASEQSSKVVELSLEGVNHTEKNANDHGFQKAPLLESKQNLSHQNIAYSLRELQKVGPKSEEPSRYHENPLLEAQSVIKDSLEAAKKSVTKNSAGGARIDKVAEQIKVGPSPGGP
jgi:hypothetical protein